MNKEIVERVAIAIFIANASNPVTIWDNCKPHMAAEYRNMARAAIAAMREPTEAMASVFLDEFPDAKSLWRGMIDAALSKEYPNG